MKLHTINIHRIRHRNTLRTGAVMLAGLIIAALAAFGAFELFTGYFDTEGRVAKAEQTAQDALDFVNGRKVDIEAHGAYGYEYAVHRKLVKLEKM